jgi:hypothetical protein
LICIKCYQVATSLSAVSNPVIAIKDNVVLYAKSSSVTVNAGSGFDSYLWSAGEVTQL